MIERAISTMKGCEVYMGGEDGHATSLLIHHIESPDRLRILD